MKQELKYLLLGCTICISCVLQSCLKDKKTSNSFGPLPIASPSFLDEKEQFEEIGFDYLDEYFHVGERVILKSYDDCDSCICSWEAEFEEGIFYKYFDCDEAGYEININFELEDLTKQNMVDLINHLFEDPNNSWNSDTTRFEPKNADAGCYYELNKKGKFFHLKYYCG